jgi:hypothetical protein
MLKSSEKDKISTMSNPVHFFMDYLKNNGLVDWSSVFRKIFPQGIIDQCKGIKTDKQHDFIEA